MRIRWNAPDGSIKVSIYVKNELVENFLDDCVGKFPIDIKTEIMGHVKEYLKGTAMESLEWDELFSMFASSFVASGGDIS